MPTRKQHYVPRTYLKAWETKVETKSEPQKKFDGVYYFQKEDMIGEGSTRESILWESNLYTISFENLCIAKKWPRVYKCFADAAFNEMKNNSPLPVYGKLGYSLIKTKTSVYKHLYDIDNWDFYYYDGRIAKKKAFLNRFNDARCYLLEDAFRDNYENSWERARQRFVDEVTRAVPVSEQNYKRNVSEETARDVLAFFFMMLCRSPQFDAMGAYSWMNSILNETFSGSEEISKLMETLWLNDLYKMFYKRASGFYHTAIAHTLKECHFILCETCSDAESFITSDNPAFQYTLDDGISDTNGYCFPIGPNYVLLIQKGDIPMNVVDYQIVDRQLVRKINRAIDSHSNKIIISKEKIRENLY